MTQHLIRGNRAYQHIIGIHKNETTIIKVIAACQISLVVYWWPNETAHDSYLHKGSSGYYTPCSQSMNMLVTVDKATDSSTICCPVNRIHAEITYVLAPSIH